MSSNRKDVFLREVQVAWPEAYPFMDPKSKQMAERLGLSRDAARLARQVRANRNSCVSWTGSCGPRSTDEQDA